MASIRIPRNVEWREIYPGFEAYKRSNRSRSYVRHIATGETHATIAAYTAGDDAIMMALYYAENGEPDKARARVESYLVFCFGKEKVPAYA